MTVDPRRDSVIRGAAAIFLAVIALGWSLATGLAIVVVSSATYTAPGPPGAREPIVGHMHESRILVWIALPAVGALVALCGGVVAAVLLARRRGVRWWVLLPPALAPALGTMGLILALLTPRGTF